MDRPLNKERRQQSQAGLLDAATRTVGQLLTSTHLETRNIAFRAMAEIKAARRLVPARREQDK